MTLKQLSTGICASLAVTLFTAVVPSTVAAPTPVEKALKTLVAEDTDANTLFSLTFYFESAHRPFSAIDAAERAIKKSPKVPGYHARLGQLLIKRKRFRDAAAAYTKAAEMDPATKSFRAAKARSLQACYMLNEAVTPWQSLLDTSNDAKETMDSARNLSSLHMTLHDPEAAERVWCQALEKVVANDWSTRLKAADNVSTAIEKQGRILAMVEFWQEFSAPLKEWHHRQAVGNRLMTIIRNHTAERERTIPLVQAYWKELLSSSPANKTKPPAARAVAETHLLQGNVKAGIGALKPYVVATDYRGQAEFMQTLYLLNGDKDAAIGLAHAGFNNADIWNHANKAADQLSRLIPTDKQSDICNQLVTRFPGQHEAHSRYAKALEETNRYKDAADEYLLALKLMRKDKSHRLYLERNHRKSVIRLLSMIGEHDRVIRLATTDFSNEGSQWRIREWLSIIRTAAGRAEAVDAAKAFGGSTAALARGAAYYLGQNQHPQLAKDILRKTLKSSTISPKDKYALLKDLASRITDDQEKAAIWKEIVDYVALNPSPYIGSYDRRNDYKECATYLTRIGKIREATDLVRKADKLSADYASTHVLTAMGWNIVHNNRVGPELRTPDGLEDALNATRDLYRDLKSIQDTGDATYRLIHGLSVICEHQVGLDRALTFLDTFSEQRSYPCIPLIKAEILIKHNRILDAEDAFKEYLECEARLLKKRDAKRKHQLSLPRLDAKFLSYAKEHKKEAEFDSYLREKITPESNELSRYFAIMALFCHQRRHELTKMQELLDVMKARGESKRFLSITRWVEGAIKMKNSKSRADTRQREQLLRQLKTHEDQWSANPENYQAAFNVYKTYVRLGRGNDGLPFLEKALAVQKNDPIILENYGRERMLIKDYRMALEMFEKAAAISGRRTDYEKSIVSACELAGKQRIGLEIALDSLIKGSNRGSVIRSREQIRDQAERSNQLPFLAELLTKRLKDAITTKTRVPVDVIELALRTAWGQEDDTLAAHALDTLPLIAGNSSWRLNRTLRRLAETAEDQNRRGHAIRLRQELLKQSQNKSPSEYSKIATLMSRDNQAEAAAELMFSGMNDALQHSLLGSYAYPPTLSNHYQSLIRTHMANTPTGHANRTTRRNWANAIIRMASQEKLNGGTAFSQSCGDKLDALIAEEMAILKRAPHQYSGPLTGLQVMQAFELWDTVTTAFETAARRDAATAEDRFALLNHLVQLAGVDPASRPSKVTPEAITAAADAYLKTAADAQAKRRVAELYARLLQNPKEKDPKRVILPIATVLDAFDNALKAELRTDLLKKARAIATTHEQRSHILTYAQKLYSMVPEDNQNLHILQMELLRAGQVSEAMTLIRKELGEAPAYSRLLEASNRCLGIPGPESSTLAIALMSDCFKAYDADLKVYVAMDKDQMARTRAQLERALMKAQVRANNSAEAAALFFKAMKNHPIKPDYVGLPELIDAFKKTDSVEKLAVLFAKEVADAPKDVNYRLGHAAVLLADGKVDAAAVAMRIAKALDPSLDTVKKLIDVLRKAGELQIALKECELWADNFPKDPDAWRTMAAIYKDMKDPKGELRARTMLVAVAPREATGCRSVAVTMVGEKDFKRAIALFERAMELRPEEPYRHIDLAEALYLDKQYERAAEICEKALSNDWQKGLSPELRRRMPNWKGTFETRTHSLLVDIYTVLGNRQKVTRSKSELPKGYQRPELKDAVPSPVFAGTGFGTVRVWPRR